jgi:undecaprenyl-diphosphatase
MPTTSSFPSGHSAAAFAFATGVGHTLPHAAVPLRALAAVVAYSRVHTGVHYPGDVVVGALIGAALAQATARVIERRA